MKLSGLLVILTFVYSQAVLISKLPLPGAYDDTIIGQGTATFLTKAEAARVRREQAVGTLRTSYSTDKLPEDDDPRHKNEPGFYGPNTRNGFRGSDRNHNRIGDRNEYRGSDRNGNGSGYRNDNSGERNEFNGGRFGNRDRNEQRGDRNDYRGDRNEYRGDRNEYRGDRNDNRGEDRNRNDFRDDRFDGSYRRDDNRGGNRDDYRGNRDDSNRGSNRSPENPSDRRGDPRYNYGSNEILNDNRRDYYPTHDPKTNQRKYEECGNRCGPNSYANEDGPPRSNPPRVIFIQPRPLQRPRPDGYQGAVLRGGPRPGGYQGNEERRGPPNDSGESEPPYRNRPPGDREGIRGPPSSWEPRSPGFRQPEGGRNQGGVADWEGRRNNIYPRASGLIPVYDTPVGSFEHDRVPGEDGGSGRRSQQPGPGSGFEQDERRTRDCMDEQGRRDMSRPGCASRWKADSEESLTGDGTVGFYGRARRE